MARRDSDVDGLVIVDKASGMTSHDVVSRLRRILGTRKVGHAGTLDPMATGVLVVGVGRATRLLTHLRLGEKAYLATIRLGASTVTDDADGESSGGVSTAGLDVDDVGRAMGGYRGAIRQRPTSVSAIRVDGERAYTRVRAGEEVDLPEREVTVRRFEMVRAARATPDLLDVEVEVECSSGTYIRALARDLGAELGVGGHLVSLRRTSVGPFGLDVAHPLEVLAEADEAVTYSLPAAMAASFAIRSICAAQAESLSYGQFLDPWDDEAAPVGTVYGAVDDLGRAVALLRDDRGRARPVLVFIGRG